MVFCVFDAENAVFWGNYAPKVVPNDAKVRPNVAKVVQNVSIFCLFEPRLDC